MLKKIISSEDNFSNCVAFVIRGSKKRRSMALLSANNINLKTGVGQKLSVIK